MDGRAGEDLRDAWEDGGIGNGTKGMALEGRAVVDSSAAGWVACQRDPCEPDQANEGDDAPDKHSEPDGTCKVRERNRSMGLVDKLHPEDGDRRHEHANERWC